MSSATAGKTRAATAARAMPLTGLQLPPPGRLAPVPRDRRLARSREATLRDAAPPNPVWPASAV
jgi:hypothetical protein